MCTYRYHADNESASLTSLKNATRIISTVSAKKNLSLCFCAVAY